MPIILPTEKQLNPGQIVRVTLDDPGQILAAVIRFTMSRRLIFYLSVPHIAYIMGYGLRDRMKEKPGDPPKEESGDTEIRLSPNQVFTIRISRREKGTFEVSRLDQPQIIIDELDWKSTILYRLTGSTYEDFDDIVKTYY